MSEEECDQNSEWFERYMRDYVKEASTFDLFEKLKNVTKKQYLPLIDELLERYNMRLQKGQKVIVNGSLWDCKPSAAYDYRNAEGVVTELTHGWPVIEINGQIKLIAWDHIKIKDE